MVKEKLLAFSKHDIDIIVKVIEKTLREKSLLQKITKMYEQQKLHSCLAVGNWSTAHLKTFQALKALHKML